MKHGIPGGLLNLGFGNVVPRHRVVAILVPQGAPVKRLRDDARESGRLVDATQGRRTRALVLVDSGHVFLSALQAETLAGRFEGRASPHAADEDLADADPQAEDAAD